jgi:hypothetical protein
MSNRLSFFEKFGGTFTIQKKKRSVLWKLAEGREWHRLLAVCNIRSSKSDDLPTMHPNENVDAGVQIRISETTA